MQISQNTKKSEWDDIQNIQTEPQPEEYVSVCDIWKDCVTKTIRKVESQTPVYMQTFLQIHTEYLHCIDNLFGTCYLWQRQYFDKLGIGKSTINEYGKFCDVMITEIGNLMDAYLNNKKIQSDMIIEMMKTYNSFIRQGIDWHAKILTSINVFADSQKNLWIKQGQV